MLLDILLELKSFKDDLSKGLKDQRDMRKMIPKRMINKVATSDTTLDAADEMLNLLMSFEKTEDPRFSDTLYLYN
tara:strand:- start:846 stop:1070 length:225 start_codon:yes stop_codon:yes gene_type:complete